MLFTILDPESKYKAKNFMDTVMQRGSDWAGVWLHVFLQSLGFGLSAFAALCGGSMVAVGAISWGLGRAFERRRAGTS